MRKWIGPIVKVSRLPPRFQWINKSFLKICENKVSNAREWFSRFLFALTRCHKCNWKELFAEHTVTVFTNIKKTSRDIFNAVKLSLKKFYKSNPMRWLLVKRVKLKQTLESRKVWSIEREKNWRWFTLIYDLGSDFQKVTSAN